MIKDVKQSMVPRRGPSPLPIHVGLAMAEYACIKDSSGASRDDIKKMMDGIRKYQNHPYRRSMELLPVIWEKGETRVMYCAADKPAASLFLVPSLINKSFILDLLPEKSFVRWLAKEGIDVYLLDWGNPVEDPGMQNIESLVNRLGLAMEMIWLKSEKKIHALGYCMGGTLLAAASMHQPQNLCSVIFLASPWDFDAGDRFLATQVKFGSPNALQMIEGNGYLPMDWIQSVFAAVNANRAMHKFSEFSALDNASDEAHLFVAVEDWLNDGVDMPGALAKMCILDWYGGNKPGKGVWEVAGKVMDLRTLDVPIFVVASLNDRLVPRESSMAMANLLPRARTLEPSSGHIGMMTGRKAMEQVWQPVAEWIRENA